MASKSSAPLPQARPPIERMMKVHQAILGGKYPNASSLARELEVSTKSVHRDLEFMRDRLGLPLAYDGQRWGYYYTEPVSAFPSLQISEGELFALLVAEKAVQQYRGSAFEKPLVSAFNKMAASLPDTISFNLAAWEQTISFRLTAEPIFDLNIFNTLAAATTRRRQLEITYRKPGVSQSEQRVIDPYHLANINGDWFLFAYDHLRKDVRTFAPSRVKAAKYTGKAFDRPRKFSAETLLRDSFAVRSGADTHNVVIRFDKTAADYVREKRWHASQRLKELRDGSVELHMKVSSLAEVERWVLAWGGKAVVLRPQELIHSVQTSARALLKARAR
jgi:predicted DNA-binding transcriptional regulator YafY